MTSQPSQNFAGKSAIPSAPDATVSVRDTFGIDIDWQVPAFSAPSEHVPALDPSYVFDPDTTLAILAGFAHNRRASDFVTRAQVIARINLVELFGILDVT